MSCGPMASDRRDRRVTYPLVVCLTVFALIGARAQDRPAQPGFRTGTELIRVDFTVTDKAGRPVPGLTAKDVSVKEDGKEQAIVGFDAFAHDAATTHRRPRNSPLLTLGYASTMTTR